MSPPSSTDLPITYSVPPPLIRKDLIERMRADAEEIMPPQFLDCLRNMRPFFTPICDFSTSQLVFGRVALVGDAASAHELRYCQDRRRCASARVGNRQR